MDFLAEFDMVGMPDAVDRFRFHDDRSLNYPAAFLQPSNNFTSPMMHGAWKVQWLWINQSREQSIRSLSRRIIFDSFTKRIICVEWCRSHGYSSGSLAR